MRKITKFLILVFFGLLLFYKITTDNVITKIGGFSILQIGSGSMEKELLVGDIIIIKECDEYEINDIITYNVNNQYLVTHRIVEERGNTFVTKGDNNNTVDSQLVTKDKIEGKVISNSKLLKWIYNHWIVIVLVIFLILIMGTEE